MDDLKTNVAALLRLIWHYEKTGDIQELNAELLECIGAQIGTACRGNPAPGGPPAPSNSPLEIFTDGGCSPNPGRGGWGFVAVQDGRSIKECYGGERDTTNNRMEITGIIKALLWLPPDAAATIVADSKLYVEVLSGNFHAKSNLDLVERAQALVHERRVQFRWTRAHCGERWNERADALATQGMGTVSLIEKERPRS